MVDYSKMKVVDLKAELKRLGLPQAGLKAELVERLTTANDEGMGNEDSEPSTEEKDDRVTDQEPTQPSNPQQGESSKPAEPEKSATEAEPAPNEQPANETAEGAAQDKPENTNAPIAAPIAAPQEATISETPSVPPTEVIQDIQKRKRRSTSPPPSAEESAPKRLRQEGNLDSPAVTTTTLPTDLPSAAHESSSPSKPESHQPTALNVEVDGMQIDDDAKQPLNFESGGSYQVQDSLDIENSHPNGHSITTDLGNTREDAAFNEEGPLPSNQELTNSPTGPSVEPSVHPATCALYIKNLMRPLRPQALRDYILELATPTNAPIDSSTLVNFYLDNIRTHAFAVFTSVSGASRVRNALHDRVWPDESNRKALWLDFIPPDRVAEWIEMELEPKETLDGGISRWEVSYDRDGYNNVTAYLDSVDGAQASKRPPTRREDSPPVHPERRTSIPTGPRIMTGIENAPTGPRNRHSNNAQFMNPSRQERIEPGFIETVAYPRIGFRPVPPDLADRRLEVLANAKSKYYNESSGKDYHRYYFERNTNLVNRGPEIFLGIRPPHREKERREQLARGGGDRDRGSDRDRNGDRDYRDRRGLGPAPSYPGGDRRRRGGRNQRHRGVPKGGERYRPGGHDYERGDYGGRDRGRLNDGYGRR
ncbi:hypothetical protein F5Y18DRAFT_176549 [Xylariaceae sp. FL1019]|nr:hypothetical protein F5Y18DRAFT_176549 [Xylariaceae sp. FL1019]